MGKRGLNVWGRMLLGSTTTKVLRESHVPILTVGHAAKKPAVKKILVPSSFSPADNVSLEWALEFAGKLGASVVLLHIFQAHKSWDNVKGDPWVDCAELLPKSWMRCWRRSQRRNGRVYPSLRESRHFLGRGPVSLVSSGRRHRYDCYGHACEKRSTSIFLGKCRRACDQGSSLPGHYR
jgi:hypothetical protein